MTVETGQDAIVARLRANLAAAGIKITDDDIDGMVDKGFLRAVLAYENVLERTPVDVIPDYLAAWGRTSTDHGQTTPSNGMGGLRAEHREDRVGYPSLAETAARVATREVSPVELTQAALERIAERDPLLNAFQVVLPDSALEAARAAEREILAGDYRGPLHGIPLAVKDLFAMTGTRTTAGSKVFADLETDFDAAVVERIRAAGSVIVGKTRMSEFAYSPGSNNAHYGWTHNPWNLDHDTGGSSSGSGAAVADGLVFGALGSDTGGSIRMPAALCGIVGHKPTFGLCSLYGAATLSWSLDHPGPMTRTVEDTAIMLNVLAGYDPRDPRTRQGPVDDYRAGLDAGVAGLRIGVLGEDGTNHQLATDEAMAAWQGGLDALAANGAELIQIDIPEMHDLRALNGGLIAMEAAAFHQPMLAQRLDDFGEFMRHRILAAYAYGPLSFVRGQQARAVIRRRLDPIFEQVDLLSTPMMPYSAPLLGDPGRNTWFSGPFNTLGWPAISVPVGLGEGRLPLALQLIGRPWDDATVLRAAAVVEAEGPWPGGTP